MSQDEFSQTSFYKEYACFIFSNFPIYPPGFANLSSPFPRAHASLPTLFDLKTNVKQGGRVGKGVGCSLLEQEQSTEIGLSG